MLRRVLFICLLFLCCCFFLQVSVEGNIGCGKSTLLKYFEKFPNKVETLAEPIEKWTNLKGHNILVSSRISNNSIAPCRNGTHIHTEKS